MIVNLDFTIVLWYIYTLHNNDHNNNNNNNFHGTYLVEYCYFFIYFMVDLPSFSRTNVYFCYIFYQKAYQIRPLQHIRAQTKRQNDLFLSGQWLQSAVQQCASANRDQN